MSARTKTDKSAVISTPRFQINFAIKHNCHKHKWSSYGESITVNKTASMFENTTNIPPTRPMIIAKKPLWTTSENETVDLNSGTKLMVMLTFE